MQVNFSCICGNSVTIEKNNNYNSINCPKCKKKFVCPEIVTPKLTVQLVDGAIVSSPCFSAIFS